VGLLKETDSFEVPHPIDEGVTLSRGVDHYFRLIRQFVDAIIIGKSEHYSLFELPHESDIKVDQLSFKDIGQGLRVWNDALYYVIVVG